MNAYQRIFGAGPRGSAISVALFAVAYFVAPIAGLPEVSSHDWFSLAVFGSLAAVTFALIAWSVRSLPPSARGKGLCSSGAFRFFRHPLYAAFLTFFNFGLAVLLNDWIYVAWAVLLHPLWHWNVAAEERLMRSEFPNEYEVYAARTGRFIPRLWPQGE